MISIVKSQVIQLFENISGDKIVDIATKVGRGVVKDVALSMKHKMDVESFLECFETRMKTAPAQISHQKSEGNQKVHSYIIKHNLEKN